MAILSRFEALSVSLTPKYYISAVAMHTFTSQCDSVIAKVLGGDRADAIAGFEQTCLDSADSHLFLEAIMSADCSNANGR